jgi:hypothetical protein
VTFLWSVPGILRKSLGFGVFAEIFSKNIVIPSKEVEEIWLACF